jgi:hypothetical protein
MIFMIKDALTQIIDCLIVRPPRKRKLHVLARTIKDLAQFDRSDFTVNWR